MLEVKHRKLIDNAIALNILIIILHLMGNGADMDLWTIISIAILSCSSLFLYNIKKTDYQIKKYDRIKTILIGVLLLFVMPISSILLFIAAYHMDESKCNITRGSPQIDPEQKKLDLLLKLGVGMVIISGLIFSTSTWNYISDVLKMIILMLIGFSFIGLSLFSEKKIKIEKTTKMYWLVGISFIFFSYFSIGYFGILGNQFTFEGTDRNLFIGTLLIVSSLLSFGTYYKFKEEFTKNFTGVLFVLGLVYIFANNNINFNIVLLVVNMLLLITLPFKTNLRSLLDFITKFFVLFTIIQFDWMEEALILILNMAAIISSVFILYYKKNNSLSAFLTIFIIVYGVLNLSLSTQNGLILITIILSAYYMLLMNTDYKVHNKDAYKKYQIGQNVVLAFIMLISLDFDAKYALIIATILLVTHVVSYFRDDKNKIELYTGPFKIAYMTAASIGLFSNIDGIYSIIIIFLVSAIMHLITDEDKLKFIYFLIFIGFYCLGIVNLYSNKFYLASIMMIAYSILFYVYTKLSKDKFYKSINIHAFILMLYIIYKYIYEVPLLSLAKGWNFLIVILAYGLISYLERKKQLLVKVVSVAAVIPFLAFTNEVITNYEVSLIFSLGLYFYVIFVGGNLFIQNAKSRDISQSILYVILILFFVFTDYLLVGLTIGVLALIILFKGLTKEEYKWHFYTGIVITVLNIIIQLAEVWSKIPFWLYLLVGGLLIIFIATNKQMKKIEKK